MKSKDRNLIYVFFILLSSLVIFFMAKIFIGYAIGQNIYWGNRSYKVGVYSIEFNNGKTIISVNVSENISRETNRYNSRTIPPLNVYLIGNGYQRFPESSINENGRVIYTFDTAIAPEIIVVYIEGQYNNFHTHLCFEGKTRRPIHFFIPPDEAIDIYTLIEQNKIKVNITGYSLERISLNIENISGTTQYIKAGIGIWAKSNDKAVQDMAIISDCAFIMEAGKTYILDLPVVCLNKNRLVPDRNNTFVIQRFEYSEKTFTTLRELNAKNAAHSDIQSIIWGSD